MKTAIAAAAIVCALVPFAHAQDSSPGRDLAIAAFEALDANDRGYVDMGQANTYGGEIFVSMDANEDAKIDLDEFLAWDFGMRPLAEEQGALPAYEAALRVVHAFWDRNGDGDITRAEHRQAVLVDFQRADVNNDAVLDQAEFLNGFTVMVAIRAAIAPHIR